jgi:hypothetical protein
MSRTMVARYPSGFPDATKVDARVAVKQARAVYESIQADLIAPGLSW